MHIEILIEDSSGKRLLDVIVPKILGNENSKHTWRIHEYKGIGRIPKNLKSTGNPSKRMLLDQLPKLLAGYGRTPGIDAVIVVLDSDRQDCAALLGELHAVASRCNPSPRVLFRLAIEEMEAWYFGDRDALARAYPKAKRNALDRYIQDSVCGTWEILADAVYPGGSAAVKKKGWPLSGQLKHEWAEKIGPFMNLEANDSHSFCKFRDGIRRLIS